MQKMTAGAYAVVGTTGPPCPIHYFILLFCYCAVIEHEADNRKMHKGFLVYHYHCCNIECFLFTRRQSLFIPGGAL